MKYINGIFRNYFYSIIIIYIIVVLILCDQIQYVKSASIGDQCQTNHTIASADEARRTNSSTGIRDLFQTIACGIQTGARKLTEGVETSLNSIKLKITSKQWNDQKQLDNSSDSFVFELPTTDDDNDQMFINNNNNNNNSSGHATTTTTITPPTSFTDARTLLDVPLACPMNQRRGRDNRCHQIFS